MVIKLQTNKIIFYKQYLMISKILVNTISICLFICYYINYYIFGYRVRHNCDNNIKNIAITICCDGRGHFTQFMNYYNISNEKKHIKIIFLNEQMQHSIPQYFIQFCEKHNIIIEWLNQNKLYCKNGIVDYFTTFIRNL